MDWDDIQREFDRVNEMSCKPVGLQKYKVGHIFDENMSVKWNREKLEEENKKYNDEVARLNTEKNKGFCRANDLVYQKIREEVGHGLSEHAAAVIFNYAYESKHAYGFYAVRQELESLIELVSEILKEKKQIRRNKRCSSSGKQGAGSSKQTLPPVCQPARGTECCPGRAGRSGTGDCAAETLHRNPDVEHGQGKPDCAERRFQSHSGSRSKSGCRSNLGGSNGKEV